MGYYYKYNFTSPERIYSIVQEELKSYFDTGAVDSLMFPIYLDKCLRKLGRATYVISEVAMFIEDFQSRLPDNFYAVREAWMCTEVNGYPYQTANSFYSQAASACTIQIAPMTVNEVSCADPVCPPSQCDSCMPHLVQAVYKTNNEVMRTYVRQYMLKPGNISVRGLCDVNYMEEWQSYSQFLSQRQFTPNSSTYDSFDIRDNKFVTNFRNGVVNLVFYATEYDESQNHLIPDNYWIMEYVEAFIKYKVFETLTNQVNDETFNQLQEKLARYKQASDEAYISALTEIRKQTAWQRQRRIKNQLHRFDMYELPTQNDKYIWRRNM